jgi:hypothetical protein
VKVALKRPPAAFGAYLLGLALLVVGSFVPSTVDTHYSVAGTIVAFVLLMGLGLGSGICRRLLIVIGLISGVGTFFLQTGALDPVATIWSLGALLVTGLLLTEPMRLYTRGWVLPLR